MNKNYNNFGDRLCLLRKQKGLSQKELADILGYKHHASISSIESNKTSPDITSLQKIAETFDVDLHWLITGRQATLEAMTKCYHIAYMQLHKEYEDALKIETNLEFKKNNGQLTQEEETSLLISKGKIKSLPRMMQNLLEHISRQ